MDLVKEIILLTCFNINEELISDDKFSEEPEAIIEDPNNFYTYVALLYTCVIYYPNVTYDVLVKANLLAKFMNWTHIVSEFKNTILVLNKVTKITLFSSVYYSRNFSYIK